MTLVISSLNQDISWFPKPDQALEEPNGLLAFGGDLSPERLKAAYSNGLFPWFSEGDPILWWCPNPRSVLYPELFKPSRSLLKFMRNTDYSVHSDTVFENVLDGCATTREDTWITPEMHDAYSQLHQMGTAHSMEYWLDGELRGGLYGLQIGAVFFGESMFSTSDNASKVAFFHLCQHLIQIGVKLIDCQVHNPHLASLGAVEISRDTFLEKLKVLIQQPVEWGQFHG
ncbi:leucyl/phenylalanyl-tRNA--protein transferase [Bermanella sp. R86510]|uniref:leucyl/phenylalanyl-tRNA--protein transferase n=1 Tax=unclassified Bermanella TaxID=2627862 RepID=UPI0037C5DF2A